MGYPYMTFPLPALSTRQRTLLEVSIRQIATVISAYAGNQLTVYYQGRLPLAAVNERILQAVSACRTLPAAVPSPGGEEASPFAAYRRDAILAGAGLVGLQLLRMAMPGTFTALYMARSAFVLFVARKFKIGRAHV
jgi:cation-transporting P-type ATPase C